MRELRHDFRRYYSCCYDEVDADEALDLIASLPNGSRFVASKDPLRSWSDERVFASDIIDAITEAACIIRGIDLSLAPKVVRPADIYARSKAAQKASAMRERIDSTEWEEVNDG